MAGKAKPSKPEERILVVEDDVDVAEMLESYFENQGYTVHAVNWGEEAVQAGIDLQPDLVILDIRLPDIDGYEVARRLRANRRTEDIPIIFLTEKRERNDRLQGLEIGADDYITKPFDFQELRLRVRNAMRRTNESTLTNPVTGLAEGVLVDERLRECVQNDGWAILLIAIENLDDFRESYGFVASDDVQRAISLIITNTVRGMSSPNDFIGQLDPNTFLLVTSPASIASLEGRIRDQLDQALDFFYPLEDLSRKSPNDRRLGLYMNSLRSSDGPFKSLGNLKAALLRH